MSNDTFETVIVAPVLLFVLGLVVVAGLLGRAQSPVTTAARDAARAGSLERDYGSAQTAAEDAARSSLALAGVNCRQVDVMVSDSSTFAPGGWVSVQLTCTIELGNLVPGLPGERQISSSAVDVVDRYREGT